MNWRKDRTFEVFEPSAIRQMVVWQRSPAGFELGFYLLGQDKIRLSPCLVNFWTQRQTVQFLCYSKETTRSAAYLEMEKGSKASPWDRFLDHLQISGTIVNCSQTLDYERGNIYSPLITCSQHCLYSGLCSLRGENIIFTIWSPPVYCVRPAAPSTFCPFFGRRYPYCDHACTALPVPTF